MPEPRSPAGGSSGNYRALLVLPLGLTAISFASVFIRLCEAPSLVIAAYRLTLAAIVLVVFSLPRNLGEFRRLTRAEILPSLLAGVFLCLHFALWITSLQYTSVASSVIFVTTNPIFVALASVFLLREKISAKLLLSIVLAVSGGIVIAWNDWGAGEHHLYGDLLALLGAVMATGYLLVGRRIRQKVNLAAYITLVYGVAAVLLIVLALAAGHPAFGYSPRTYLFFCLLALFPQLIGHTSLNWALKFFSAAVVAVFILAEPIGASILAYVILEEKLGMNLFIGGALVLLGIYLSAREERRIGIAGVGAGFKPAPTVRRDD
ncbi:MAG TPA: DMT family transporter [Thermodesulfobacteriota bacterium]|nr:DMT family transporter [Thermodesulfobacteriota bacterium]